MQTTVLSYQGGTKRLPWKWGLPFAARVFLMMNFTSQQKAKISYNFSILMMKTNQLKTVIINYSSASSPPLTKGLGATSPFWKLKFRFSGYLTLYQLASEDPQSFLTRLWSMVVKFGGGRGEDSLGSEFISWEGLSSGVVERVRNIWVLTPDLSATFSMNLSKTLDFPLSCLIYW